MNQDLRKDLRDGTIVALIAVTLFVILLFKIGSKGGEHGYYVSSRIEAARQPDARSFNEPPTRVNAEAVPVLCYHFFRSDTSPLQFARILGGLLLNLPVLGDLSAWTQNRSEFDREMRHLHREGYRTVDLTELAAWRRGEIVLPEKSVAITFDDGDRSVLEVAWPVLEKYGFTATIFIVTSRVGHNWDGVRGMTWDELAVLHGSGTFSIESHSHDLHYKERTFDGPLASAVARERFSIGSPSGEWRDDVLNDLSKSRRLIADSLGHDARHLAWPYGQASAALDSVAAEAGFTSVSMLEGGMNDPHRAGQPTLAARDVYAVHLQDDILTVGIPGHVPRSATSRFTWERHEVKRYAITARTSIRDFKEMLAD